MRAYTLQGFVLTIGCDSFKWLLEQVEPVEVQAMKPWRDAARLKFLGIDVRILLLHGGEPRDAQVREELTILPAMGCLRCAGDHCDAGSKRHRAALFLMIPLLVTTRANERFGQDDGECGECATGASSSEKNA